MNSFEKGHKYKWMVDEKETKMMDRAHLYKKNSGLKTVWTLESHLNAWGVYRQRCPI